MSEIIREGRSAFRRPGGSLSEGRSEGRSTFRSQGGSLSGPSGPSIRPFSEPYGASSAPQSVKSPATSQSTLPTGITPGFAQRLNDAPTASGAPRRDMTDNGKPPTYYGDVPKPASWAGAPAERSYDIVTQKPGSDTEMSTNKIFTNAPKEWDNRGASMYNNFFNPLGTQPGSQPIGGTGAAQSPSTSIASPVAADSAIQMDQSSNGNVTLGSPPTPTTPTTPNATVNMSPPSALQSSVYQNSMESPANSFARTALNPNVSTEEQMRQQRMREALYNSQRFNESIMNIA